ncbi:MAG: hypothetical protein WA865_16950 [Spirulinaceae cyanobacterium]
MTQPDKFNNIAAKISQCLAPHKITSTMRMQDGCLQIVVEAKRVPDQEIVISSIQTKLLELNTDSLQKIELYGLKKGDKIPSWYQELSLQSPSNLVIQTEPEQQFSLFNSVLGTVGETAERAKMAVKGGVTGAAEVVAGTATGMRNVLGGAAVQATKGMGYVIDLVSSNALFAKLTKTLPVDWLIIIDRVDVNKAEAEVKKLLKKYPQDSPREIAHRLMVEKSILVAGTGVASSLVPGAATAMFALDLATTLLLQAELVYQIACAYGLDLEEDARKAEVLAIFGIGLGGGQALKVGATYAAKASQGFLRNIPIAGPVIGGSSNAVMLYSLGYAACSFYEAKVNPLNSEAALAASQAEGQKYLEAAIAQEVIMDQVLAHVVAAAHPDKSWEEILPQLETLNLSRKSLEAIADNIDSPEPLEALLEQVNSDFAAPLLAQCYKIAQLEAEITPQESEILEKINQKLNDG